MNKLISKKCNGLIKVVTGIRRQLEIDFVCNKGFKRYYIQSAYAIPDSRQGTGGYIFSELFTPVDTAGSNPKIRDVESGSNP